MKIKSFYSCLLLYLIISSCQQEPIEKISPSSSLFKLIPSSHSNITFQNNINESNTINLTVNDNIYGGGGVAVGDINNDGLTDIYFVANQGQHALYLNKGNFVFSDIIQQSGIPQVDGWCTGVVMEDVNQDGFLDIYVCRAGKKVVQNPELKKNLLFINNKDNTFTERAAEYGLDDGGNSTQATFFDYDLDGDLDMYVVNIPSVTRGKTSSELKRLRLNPVDWKDSDHFYRNEGNDRFVEISNQIGLSNWGQGLGVGIFDTNKDLFPEIYVTNDFETDNFFFKNQGNGTFKEIAPQTFRHVSHFAMGVDIADIDNNGHLDIFEVEMLPKDRKRSVLNMQPMSRQLFEELLLVEMVPQTMRNCLHLNRGYGIFSEVAQYASIQKTDWSWATLLLDLDDDGWRDILVTNGIIRDIGDRDFAKKGNELAKQFDNKLTIEQHLSIAPSNRIANHAFQNKRGIQFNDVSNKWGFDFKGFSNGMAYADFDGDGDMDIVVNNLQDSPLLYKNTSAQRGNNYINFKFNGQQGNFNAIGAKVSVFAGDQMQYHENYTVRGFQSSSQHLMHFGLGENTHVDSIVVVWPLGQQQTIRTKTKANQTVVLDYKNATETYIRPRLSSKYMRGASNRHKINFVHKEKPYDDFERERLIPHKMSQLGPALATGDVNGDGLEDFFVGGAHLQAAVLFTSVPDGTFQQFSSSTWEFDKSFEDIGACFFDFDNDNDLDLYVSSGSNEFDPKSSLYQDRLYINDGHGNFTRNASAVPTINASGGRVRSADFDGDGFQDLFVCGRQNPGKYPLPGKSFILKNNGKQLVDITSKVSDLQDIGMVTDIAWSDYDNDKDLDLLLCGEWMGVKVFNNENGHFTDVSQTVGLTNTNGWWFSISPCDYDKDGDEDFVLGNIGLNHKFQATQEKPFQVFCNDFDDSGNLDIVLAFDQKDKLYPVRGRDCSSEQMPFITDKFPTFAAFGDADINTIFDKEKLDEATHKKVELFATVLLSNEGGKFVIKQLPKEVQFSAVTGAVTHDFNHDGHQDLMLAGNMYQTEAETSRADASLGVMLLGDGKGDFKNEPLWNTALFAPGDVKDLRKITLKDGKPLFIIANNNNKLQTYTLK